MERKSVSELLEELSTSAADSLGDWAKDVKFVYGCYLVGDERPKVMGESLNIISSKGLTKIATVNLAYSDCSAENELCLYDKKYMIVLGSTFRRILSREGIIYQEGQKNV